MDIKTLFPNRNFSFRNRFTVLISRIATQLSSRGWVDPVPDPILPEKFLGVAGNRIRDPGTSVFVVRQDNCHTLEAVISYLLG